MKCNSTRKGLSLAELMTASSLAIVVIAGIYTLSQFAHLIWKTEQAKSNLAAGLETAMERMQREIRMTDGHQIFYYPQGAVTFTAVSFPLAVDDDGDGFIEVDSETGRIGWDQTVIYHVYNNASTHQVELRRTVFDPRINMSSDERQRQLDEVAANGHPVSGTPNYSGWDEATGTRALCENDDIILQIVPSVREFDGYGQVTARSDNVTFGSIPLASGTHYITFTVVGKNSASCGYYLGIDSFSISPSGGIREGEDAPVRSFGGSPRSNEEMIAFGCWSGNRHLEYMATGIDDYISLFFDYDQWTESNFATSSPYNTAIEYLNRTGDGRETSLYNEDVARLAGCGDAWSAMNQTGATAKSTLSLDVAGSDGMIFRNVIMSRNIDIEGRAATITFDNVSAAAMTIDYAGIMTRLDGSDGDPATLKQIMFDNGIPSVTIVAGSSKDSDWIDINNFDKSKDYLVTFHVPFTAGAHDMSGWTTADGLKHSYVLEGSAAVAQDPTWNVGGAPKYSYVATDKLYAADSIDVSYFSDGTLTSQIYDTAMDDPEYSTLTWGISKNNYGDYAIGGLGADLVIRLRSDDNKDTLKASTDWTGAMAIDTLSATSGSIPISGIGTGRYVQFRADFSSRPSIGKYDYLKSCVLKKLSINWPGQTRIVDVSGYLTLRPNYGIFTVSIDGYILTKGLEVTLKITQNLSGAKSVTKYLTGEAQPRNTGK